MRRLGKSSRDFRRLCWFQVLKSLYLDVLNVHIDCLDDMSRNMDSRP